jgi:hypothetical protein
MSLGLTAPVVRAHIPLHVFLRLTRMDVCCGPPAANLP